jgi:hypothetical protein
MSRTDNKAMAKHLREWVQKHYGAAEAIDPSWDINGAAGAMAEVVAPLRSLVEDVSALRTNPEYWAMPECVHKLIAKAQEATHAA